MDEIEGTLIAHRMFLQALVFRLRDVPRFQMMGLVQDLSKIEAELGMDVDVADDVLEAAEEELQRLIEMVQNVRLG